MKVITILGTRPEIIKLSPVLDLLEKDDAIIHKVIHSGQHYDHNMDAVFFEELGLGRVDYPLGIGSHSQGKQTGLMLEKIEEVLVSEKPDLVIVQGDTNTTLAGALAAVKLHIPTMHIEAGCRSFNRKMPEEINRTVTDAISDYCIAPDKKSVENLKNEGVKAKVFALGNTSFDAALRNKEFARSPIIDKLKLKDFILVTIHRAESTDNAKNLKSIIGALEDLAKSYTVVFPMHPRTRKALEREGLSLEKVKVIEPQAYLSFIALLSSCKVCISDSGGIQEEALVFDVPCLIPRNETEWTRLVDAGKNFLLGVDRSEIVRQTKEILGRLDEIKAIDYDYPKGVSAQIVSKIHEVLNGNS